MNNFDLEFEIKNTNNYEIELKQCDCGNLIKNKNADECLPCYQDHQANS